MFYVLHVSAARSWVLTPEGCRSAAEARAAVAWQMKGGDAASNYRVCTWDRARNRFVSRPEDQRPDAGSALVPDVLATWAPDRGPYTEEAFAAFCAALGYDPDADDDGDWGRAHAAAHDMADKAYAEIVADRYRLAPRWAGYKIKVGEYGSPPRYYIAAALRG